MFLFNRKLSCLGISDAHLYSSYSLNKIILDDSPVFFGLVEAGNSQPGSGLLPRQPLALLFDDVLTSFATILTDLSTSSTVVLEDLELGG